MIELGDGQVSYRALAGGRAGEYRGRQGDPIDSARLRLNGAFAFVFVLSSMSCIEEPPASTPCVALEDCPSTEVCFEGTCVTSPAACTSVNGEALPDGTECGDGVCIAAACVPPRCGDGVVNEPEQCDDGDLNGDDAPNACRTTCAPAGCGDGTLDEGEACDDGALNDDGDPNACRTTCLLAGCGDAVLDDGELCDDGNVESGDGCRGDCGQLEACGDEVLDVGEACDDGNDNPVDGCDLCRVQTWSREVLVSGGLVGPAGVGFPSGVAVDALGRVFISDAGNHRIVRLEDDGSLTKVAGTGAFGFSGDGGPATNAQLGLPRGLVFDALGRLYVAEEVNNRVRRIDVDGTIATVAGTGVFAFSGDDGPATSAALRAPDGVAIDGLGRLLIADTISDRIRAVTFDAAGAGTITTVVGTGLLGFSGDGGPATSAQVTGPRVTVDGLGRLVIADRGNHRIRRVDVDGTITTIAGTGVAGFSGDGGPALEAQLNHPRAVAVDSAGRLFISDVDNHRVRCITFDENGEGTITTVAGTGVSGFSGDDGPATSAQLAAPNVVVVDELDRLLIADSSNDRVRRVTFDEVGGGIITTIAGTGAVDPLGDGGPATSVGAGSFDVAVDAQGRIITTDSGRLRRIDTDGTIRTIAGTGVSGFSGDGPALTAQLTAVRSMALDAAGRLFITDGHRVRRITFDALGDGIITTVAGTGVGGFSGDGGPAISAQFDFPQGIAVDDLGRLFIADFFNRRVRRITFDAQGEGTITTVAGNGGPTSSGQLAINTALRSPRDVAVDRLGGLLIADQTRVRYVDTNGRISSLVGTGVFGFTGDGGLAGNAQLSAESLAHDADGRLYISDISNHRIRRVGLDGIITTVAGNGISGVSGDAGPATTAQLASPRGLTVDALGNVLFADAGRVRRLSFDANGEGTITTVGGRVHPPGPGPFAQAQLYGPRAFASVGDTLFSVGDLGRVMRVDLAANVVDVVVGYLQPSGAPGLAAFSPLLDDARGIAFDPVALSLVITDAAELRVIAMDANDDGTIDEAGLWTSASLTTELVTPAGIAYDIADDTFVVADEDNHCVRRIDRDGVVLATVAGECGASGSLNGPTHVALSPTSGALYIADTGNHRVIRDGILVVGDLNAPGQLALDEHGNLFVTSTTTVRLVANVDGDLDADSDDRVITIYGEGDAFPESSTSCLSALALKDGHVYAADACEGILVDLAP